jgi:hypothetical protein
MYKIEKNNYGYKLTFSGKILAGEMGKWVEDSKRTLVSAAGKFGVFVDMRDLSPLTEESQALMKTGQKLYKDKGMQRSVVILNSPVITLQFKRLAQETGIYAWERYIDASSSSDWESKAINWLNDAVDPDKK